MLAVIRAARRGLMVPDYVRDRRLFPISLWEYRPRPLPLGAGRGRFGSQSLWSARTYPRLRLDRNP